MTRKTEDNKQVVSYLPLSIFLMKVFNLFIFFILAVLIFNLLIESKFTVVLLFISILIFKLFFDKAKNKQNIFKSDDFIENELIYLELNSVWISAPNGRFGIHEQIDVIITDLRLIWKFKNRYFNFCYDDIYKNSNKLFVKSSNTKIIQEIKFFDNPPSINLLIKGSIAPSWYKMFISYPEEIYNLLSDLIEKRKPNK